MKSLLLTMGLVLSLSTVHAKSLQSHGGGQGTLQVSEVSVLDMDQFSQCSFRVSIVDFTADMACTSRNAVLGTCESAIETATFIDDSCTLKVGDQILTTTDQYSSGDLRSSGLFTWVVLNAGYESQIMFPNYGK